jgi:hypothetical protein
MYLYPSLNRYEESGETNFKEWDLLYIYCLPNPYWTFDIFIDYHIHIKREINL